MRVYSKTSVLNIYKASNSSIEKCSFSQRAVFSQYYGFLCCKNLCQIVTTFVLTAIQVFNKKYNYEASLLQKKKTLTIEVLFLTKNTIFTFLSLLTIFVCIVAWTLVSLCTILINYLIFNKHHMLIGKQIRHWVARSYQFKKQHVSRNHRKAWRCVHIHVHVLILNMFIIWNYMWSDFEIIQNETTHHYMFRIHSKPLVYISQLLHASWFNFSFAV